MLRLSDLRCVFMELRFLSDALCLSCSAKTLTQSILAQERIYVAGTEKETQDTESNPDKLTMLYEEGYRQAKSQMADLKRYLGRE